MSMYHTEYDDSIQSGDVPLQYDADDSMQRAQIVDEPPRRDSVRSTYSSYREAPQLSVPMLQTSRIQRSSSLTGSEQVQGAVPPRRSDWLYDNNNYNNEARASYRDVYRERLQSNFQATYQDTGSHRPLRELQDYNERMRERTQMYKYGMTTASNDENVNTLQNTLSNRPPIGAKPPKGDSSVVANNNNNNNNATKRGFASGNGEYFVLPVHFATKSTTNLADVDNQQKTRSQSLTRITTVPNLAVEDPTKRTREKLKRIGDELIKHCSSYVQPPQIDSLIKSGQESIGLMKEYVSGLDDLLKRYGGDGDGKDNQIGTRARGRSKSPFTEHV